jgi:mRNA interferase MazF
MEYKRMQVWYADMSPVVGSEQGGYRAVVIISNDIGNRYSPVIIAAPITSQIGKKRLPTQVLIKSEWGTLVDSMVSCEQIKTLDKRRLKKLLFEITDPKLISEINQAVKISLDI